MTSNITKKVIEDLIESDKKGLEEYGVTVDREDYTLKDWLQEAYEETCDTAKYLKAAIEKLDKKCVKCGVNPNNEISDWCEQCVRDIIL
jgi:DNA-directed RNA polymerase subunit L